MLVNKTPIEEKLEFTDIAHWNHNEDNSLDLVNVETPTNPKFLKLNAKLRATPLFKEFKDIFAFSYNNLRRISEYIASHCIKLDSNISRSHQTRYRMDPNYAKAVKNDLEQLLALNSLRQLTKRLGYNQSLWSQKEC